MVFTFDAISTGTGCLPGLLVLPTRILRYGIYCDNESWRGWKPASVPKSEIVS